MQFEMSELLPARLKTFRTENGSTARFVVEPSTERRCPAQHEWLQSVLRRRGLKAYNPNISVHDPKNRKSANEIADWCTGEPFKLWSTHEDRYVSSVDVPALGASMRDTKGSARLQSSPTIHVVHFPQ